MTTERLLHHGDLFRPAFQVALHTEATGSLLDKHPKMRFTMNVFRPLAIWATAACLVVSISSFSGFLVGVYFTIRLERILNQSDSLSTVLFLLLPFLIVLLALLADSIICFLYDSLDQPPLARSTSLILTSPGIRNVYKNVGIDSIYATFLKAYSWQLKYWITRVLARPTTDALTLQENCAKNDLKYVEEWLDDYKKNVDDETKYMGTCWLISVLVNLVFWLLPDIWWFPIPDTGSKIVLVATLSFAVTSVVILFLANTRATSCDTKCSFLPTLVHALAVTSSTCFFLITDWPNSMKYLYLFMAFLYWCFQSCLTKQRTPQDTAAPAAPTAPPEGLCWSLDIVLFAMWVVNPIRAGYTQMYDIDLNVFLSGLMKCYLRTVLYMAGILIIIDVDVCRYTRESPALQNTRTITYFKALHRRLDQKTIPGGFIWYAYRGLTHIDFTDHLEEQQERAIKVQKDPDLPDVSCRILCLLVLIVLCGCLTVYLPWTFRTVLWEWSQSGKQRLLPVVLALLLLGLFFLLVCIMNFLVMFDVFCSRVWGKCCKCLKFQTDLGSIFIGGGDSDEQKRKQRQVGTEMFRRARSVVVAAVVWVGICFHLRTGVIIPENQKPFVYAALGLSLLHLVWRCTRVFTRAGWPFYTVMCCFFLVALAFQSGAWTDTSTAPFANTPIMLVSNSSTMLLARQEQETHGARLPYGACMRSWGSPSAPLSIIDLAELSWIAYAAKENVTRFLHESFSAHCTVEKNISKVDDLPRAVHVHFPPQDGGSEGTHVFAIKGTSTTTDAYADVSLFATIQTLQWFNQVVPVLSLVPLNVAQQTLYALHWLTWTQHRTATFWLPLEEEIRNVIQGGAQHVVITGHSLGGGVAQILASRLEVPAVVFSSPGIIYSATRFNISLETAERDILVVMPDGDVVPRVDRQAGQVQRIACRTPDGQQGKLTDCHSLQRTACELWRVCGDVAGRNFSATCDQFVNKSYEHGQYYQTPDHLWQSPDGAILDE